MDGDFFAYDACLLALNLVRRDDDDDDVLRAIRRDDPRITSVKLFVSDVDGIVKRREAENWLRRMNALRSNTLVTCILLRL